MSCIRYWKDLMHPSGVVCLRCGSSRVYSRNDRIKDYNCRACGTTFSIFCNTIFHKSRVEMRTWFYAIHRLTSRESRFGYPALHFQKEVQVSYPTAWKILNKLRDVMVLVLENSEEATEYPDCVLNDADALSSARGIAASGGGGDVDFGGKSALALLETPRTKDIRPAKMNMPNKKKLSSKIVMKRFFQLTDRMPDLERFNYMLRLSADAA